MPNQLRILIAAVLLLTSIGISAYYAPRLPERMPVHFNAQGNPDGYGPRKLALIFPPAMVAFICLMYAFAVTTIRNPDYWKRKLKKEVSEQSLAIMVSRGLKVIDWVMICVMLLFMVIQVESFLVGLGRLRQMTNMIIPIIAVIMAGVVYNLVVQTIELRRLK